MSVLGICRPCQRQLIKRLAIRSLATVESNPPDAETLDPLLVKTPKEEQALIKTGTFPISSRRRRAALQSARNLPFEQLPYQCFQEARKVLQEDRQEKIASIQKEREKIKKLQEREVQDESESQQIQTRLDSLRRHLEWLKIQADINDPLVKRRFEDGQGDMSRPIYRHLTRRKWESRNKLITEQRVSQMHVVPDVVPALTITADVSLFYRGVKDKDLKWVIRDPNRNSRAIEVTPGMFVASNISESPPRLDIQPFDAGERLATIAVVDPDVPNVETDGFDSRAHFLAVNVPLSPTRTAVNLASLDATSQVILPWTSPTAQKGAPYHRIAVVVFRQRGDAPIDVAKAAEKVDRDDFVLRRFQSRHALVPFGAHLFRTKWDESMAEVMRRAGVSGGDLEFKRRRVEPLPYKARPGSSWR